MGSADQRGAIFFEREYSAGVARCQRWIAGGAYSIDGSGGGRVYGAHRFQYHAADDFRGSGAATRGNRNLRADGVFGATTHAGDWHTHGLGSDRRECSGDGGAAGDAVGGDWRDDWRGGGVWVDAIYGQFALWSDGLGSVRDDFGGGGAEWCGAGGDVRARSARLARRSNRGAAI